MMLWTVSLLLLAASARSNVIPEPYSDSWTDVKHPGGKPVPLNGDPPVPLNGDPGQETPQLEGEPADGQSWSGALPDPSWRLIGPADIYWQKESPAPVGPLIVDGFLAYLNEVPSMVSVQVLHNGNVYHICGGSLATPNKVVTAAHCNKQFGQVPFQVGLGYHYISKGLQNPNSQVIKVASVKNHESYRKGSAGADLAVLTLEKNAEIKPGYVEIMKYSKAQPADLAAQRAFLVGWGQTGPYQGSSDELKFVEFEALRETDCRRFWEDYLAKESVCALGIYGGGCMGDSGGPLINSITKEQIGVVAYGNRYCSIQWPSVYTSVGYYLDWIKKHL